MLIGDRSLLISVSKTTFFLTVCYNECVISRVHVLLKDTSFLSHEWEFELLFLGYLERTTHYFSVWHNSISFIGVFSLTYLTNSWRITGDPTTPCSRLTCPPNAMCIVTVDGTAQCACSTPSCSKTSRTICGSNGKTYKNSCDMEIEACQRNETIFAQHDGRCKGRQGTAYCDAPLLYCLLISLITHALCNCQETHRRLNCCNKKWNVRCEMDSVH